MDTISWPCLQEILRWIPEPKYQARLARTCRGLYYIINLHAEELAITFLLSSKFPLSTACYYGRPLYLDICFRLGLDRVNTQEAFLSACQYGPEWVVDRLLLGGQSERVCCYEMGLWRACAGGQVEIVGKMIGLGATMVSSGLSKLAECPHPERARQIYAMLCPLLGTRRSDGEPYF